MPSFPSTPGGWYDPACAGSLATAVRGIFDADGSQTLRSRVSELYTASKGRLSLYVFGHTHEARLHMPVEMPDGLTIDALNTGAFQRLMARAYFEKQKRGSETDVDTLTRLRHDDLAACYSTVRIVYKGRRPEAELKQWFMKETDSAGRFLDDCDPACSASPPTARRRRSPRLARIIGERARRGRGPSANPAR